MMGALATARATTRILDLGHMALSTQRGETLVVLGLGSCVGLVMTTQDARAVGMAHVVLPDNPTPEEAAKKPPAFFAAPAVAALSDAFRKAGIPPQTLTVKLFGGGWTAGGKNALRIGKRNVMSVRRELWKMSLVPTVEMVGLDTPLTIETKTGEPGVLVRRPGKEETL